MHNGYKNYETFAVCVWLDNDEPVYLEAKDVVSGAMDGAAPDEALGAAAGAVKSWVEDMAPTLTSPFSELLSGALSEVDWLEVAETRLDE